jgi:hypothetical protein
VRARRESPSPKRSPDLPRRRSPNRRRRRLVGQTKSEITKELGFIEVIIQDLGKRVIGAVQTVPVITRDMFAFSWQAQIVPQ